MFSEHQTSRSSQYQKPISATERLLDEALEEMREALEQSDLTLSKFPRRAEKEPDFDDIEEIEEPYLLRTPHPSPSISIPYPAESQTGGQLWLKLLTGTAAVGLAVMLSIGGHEEGARVHPPRIPPPADVTRKPKGQPKTAPSNEEPDASIPNSNTPAAPEQGQIVAAIMDGKAKIRVYGKESFKSDIREALNKIASIPAGMALLKELNSNPEGRKVFVKYGSDPSAGSCEGERSIPCSGGDVVVEVKDLTSEGMDAKLEFVLAHELDHARRFLNGNDAGEKRAKKPGFPNREEELAVDFENVIRRGLGAAERKTYYHYANVFTYKVN